MVTTPKAALLALCITALVGFSCAGKPKKASDWKNIDFDKLDKALEDGDDPELVLTEDAIDIELMNRRKQMPIEPPAGVPLSDENEVYRHTQAAAGPAILMASLVTPIPLTGQPWDKKALEDLATKWREMLFLAGIEVTIYDMGAAAAGVVKAGETQMVVTLQHGWRGYELRDFLLQQGEVSLVEWDGVATVPDRLKTSEGGARRGGKKAGGKGKGGNTGKTKKGARRRKAAAARTPAPAAGHDMYSDHQGGLGSDGEL